MDDEKPASNPGLPERETSTYLAAGFLVGGGRFSLLRELGRGGMGLVWLAQDERLATPVALKFLPEGVRTNPVALNDLRQETHKSRMLSHPNILRIYDLYEAPDEPAFISMEYVDGPSLWVLLKQQPQGFFYWDYLKPIVKQLCEALDYAHNEKVIHRDLKPANMLLDERQRLRLADFGVASWAGTLVYMSPQQLDGQASRVTDDIYALGSTLYELLSGLPPFYQNDIAYQVRNVLATPLSERLADLEVDNEVPPAVAAMIMACLAKDPEKRPQSARAVAEWIGLTESAAAPMTSFVSSIVTSSATFVPAKDSKKTAASLAPETETEVPPAVENSFGRRLAMLIGSAGVGILAWLAWSHFMPKMPDFPALSVTQSNDVTSAASNASKVTVPTSAPIILVNGTNVSIDLGGVNHEKGLREINGLDDGVTAPDSIGGKEGRILQSRPRARCYFQISPSFKRPGPMSARVQVEYYAASPGVMQIQFDAATARQAPHYANGGRVSFDADSVWKTVNFQLNDALFHNGERGGADFRLTTTSHELYLHNVTVFFDQ
jgi:serine/threonine protein kinase